MNKTRIGALLGALLITGALFAVPFAGAAFAATDHCPDGWTDKDESGADDNDVVLDAGTEFCVKSGTEATGILVADGTTTLQEYLEAAGIVDGSGDQGRDVSHWVIYETTTTTTTTDVVTTTDTTTTDVVTTTDTTTTTDVVTTTDTTTTDVVTTDTTTDTTSQETTPEGSVEELTPPSTDTIGQPTSSSSVSTGLLLVLAGILAAVLVVVPAAARNRR
jgi:hypothetical protein